MVALLAGGPVFRERFGRVEGGTWLMDSICLETVSEVGQIHAGGAE